MQVALILPLRRNDNFSVETADGQRYVLRHHRRNRDPARVAFQITFQSHLSEKGFPALRSIPTRGGAGAVWHPEGAWVLFPHAPGEHFDFDRLDQVAEAGRPLAEFHLASADYPAAYVFCDLNPDLELWWTDGPNQIEGLARRYGENLLATEIALLRRCHAESMSRVPRDELKALTRGWVHSDYHGRNVLFEAARMTCLLDFDPLHPGFLVEDVAIGMVMFGRVARRSLDMREEAVRLFLRNYLTVNPFSAADLAALELFVWLPEPPFLPYCELLERDGQDPVAYVRDWVSQIPTS